MIELCLLTRRDEAFELGVQWAGLYPPESPSRKLIEGIMNRSYLVNIVANDFKHGEIIFEPFNLDLETNGATGSLDGIGQAVNGIANGVKEAAVNGVEGVKKIVGGFANGHANGNGAAMNGH